MKGMAACMFMPPTNLSTVVLYRVLWYYVLTYVESTMVLCLDIHGECHGTVPAHTWRVPWYCVWTYVESTVVLCVVSVSSLVEERILDRGN
jgi:hypothetical protein